MTGYLNMSAPLQPIERPYILVADVALSLLSTQWVRSVRYYPRCGSRGGEEASLWCKLQLVSEGGSGQWAHCRTLHAGLKLRSIAEELILNARCKKTSNRMGREESGKVVATI